MTPTPDPLLTSAAKRLDGAWPVDMDRLEWREALVSIEAEAIGLRAAAARDALALLAAARAADIILSATEAKALSAALDAAQPAPALDVDTLPELGRLTDYQRGYLHGFDAPVNVAARTPTPDPLREALDEAIRLTSGPGNGTITRRRSIDEWRRLDRLFREALAQPAPALDVERLMDAEHRWCVEVEGEFALNHGPDSHRRQATFILARLSGDPA